MLANQGHHTQSHAADSTAMQHSTTPELTKLIIKIKEKMAFNSNDAALRISYQALGVIDDEGNTIDNPLKKLLDTPLNFNDTDVITIYKLIADIHAMKGKYIEAMQCYQKLPEDYLDRQENIAECQNEISKKISVLLTQAKNSFFDQHIYVTKLNEARNLARSAGFDNELVKINNFEKRLQWEGKYKLKFEIDYKILMGPMPAADVEQLNIRQQQFVKCIDRYDSCIQDATAEERNMYTNLRAKFSKVKTLLADLQLWNTVRDTVNSKVQNITKNEHNESQTLSVSAVLSDCLQKYEKFANVLNDEEKLLYQTTQELLPEITNNNDLYLNQQRKEKVIEQIKDLHTDLLQGNLQLALNKLLAIRTLALQITPEQITSDSALESVFTQEYFTESIEILSKALKVLNDEAIDQGKARQISLSLITDVLRNSKFEVDKTLLPRHYNYLNNAITDTLIIEWHKFHLRDPFEYETLTNAIKQIIYVDLTTTAWWQRWAPNNWTNAGLCLHQGKKESIAKEICKLIKDYQPAATPEYVQLPILPLYKPPVSQAASYLT